MADKTTTLHLRLQDGISAAALKAAKAMHGVGQAADRLNNKKLRFNGLDQMNRSAQRATQAMLRMERELEAATRRRVAAIQAATAARQREAAAAAKAVAAARQHNSFRSRAGRFGDAAMIGGVGAAVAGRVIAPKVQKAISYDMRKARLATTMAGDGTHSDMQKAHAAIGDAIFRAVRDGGGSREDAMGGLEALASSGKFEGRRSLDALPAIVKTAHASGANPEDIAKSAAAMIEAGVAVSDLQKGFDMMLRGGRLGAFELPDMAKWMPQQLAMAKAVGLSGLDAVKQLTAINEISRTTAGTSDEAGNNVANLLQKLFSRELQKTMADTVDPVAGDPTKPGAVTGKGKKKKAAPAEFNWQGYMIARQLQGTNAIDAFVEVLDRQMAGNDEYKSVIAKLKGAKDGGERKQLIENAAKIAEGSAIGELIADRQALMAALALKYGVKQRQAMLRELDDAEGDTDRTSKFIRGTVGSQTQDAANAIDRANEQAVGAVSGPLGVLAQRVSEAAEAFPKLTAALYGATTLGAGVAAGGLGAALWWRLFGGGATGSPAAAAGAPTPGAGTGGAPGSAATGAGRAILRTGLKGGVVGGAIYGASTTALDYGFGMFPGNHPVGYDPEKEKNLGIWGRIDRLINGYKPTLPTPNPKAVADAHAAKNRIEATWGTEDARPDPRLGATAPMPPSRVGRTGGASAPLPPVRPPELQGGENGAHAAGTRMGQEFGKGLNDEIARAMAIAKGNLQSLAAGMAATIPIKVTPTVDTSKLRANHADSGVY